jgi:hypothetical protein
MIFILLLAQIVGPVIVTPVNCGVRFTQVSPPDPNKQGWAVQFTIDGKDVGPRDPAPPYEFETALTPGSHQIAGNWIQGATKMEITPTPFVCGSVGTAAVAPTFPPVPAVAKPTSLPLAVGVNAAPSLYTTCNWAAVKDAFTTGEWSGCVNYGLPSDKPGWYQTRNEAQTTCPKEPPTRVAWRPCTPKP